jgi:hypothetical protein
VEENAEQEAGVKAGGKQMELSSWFLAWLNLRP